MAEKRSNEGVVEYGLEVTSELSREIGPRPPASPAESEAAEYVARELGGSGLDPVVEQFKSARSFGPGYALVFGLGLAGSTLQRFRPLRVVGYGLAALAAITAWAEGNYRRNPLTGFLRRETSRSVHAVIEPAERAEQTVCVSSHLDSSRSGLMFHPRVTPWLGKLVAAVGAATVLQVVSRPLSLLPGARLLDRGSRLLLALGLGLVVERELFGEDVAGANDNASGVGACLALARSLAKSRLTRTRVVVLVTGSEESGTLGMRDFLERHDTRDWRFINFDGVGAKAPLRVLAREGGPLAALAADPGLLDLAAEIGREQPELVAPPLDHGSGLPYDSTPVLAAGGRAISVVNQGDGAIPDYHWPSDRMERISPEHFGRAVRFGRALLDRIDRSR